MSDQQNIDMNNEFRQERQERLREMNRKFKALAPAEAARAQSDEAVPDGYAVVDSENTFHFMIERGDYPEDSLFLCREHINDAESEGRDEGLEIKAVFLRPISESTTPQPEGQ